MTHRFKGCILAERQTMHRAIAVSIFDVHTKKRVVSREGESIEAKIR